MKMLRRTTLFGKSCITLLVILWLPTCTLASAAGTETLIGVVGRDFVMLGADTSISQSIAWTTSQMDKIHVLGGWSDVVRNTEAEENLQSSSSPCIAVAAAGDAADTDRLVGLLQAHFVLSEYDSGPGSDVIFVNCRDSAKLATGTKVSSPTTTTTVAMGLSVDQVAHLARHEIAQRLRSQAPLRTCLLVGGMMLAESDFQTMHRQDASASHQIQQQLRQAVLPFVLQPAMTTATAATLALADDNKARPRLNPRLYWLDEYGALQRVPYGAHGHASNFLLSLLDQHYHTDLTREEAEALVRTCFDQLRIRYVINAPRPPCIKCIDESGCRILTQADKR